MLPDFCVASWLPLTGGDVNQIVTGRRGARWSCGVECNERRGAVEREISLCCKRSEKKREAEDDEGEEGEQVVNSAGAVVVVMVEMGVGGSRQSSSSGSRQVLLLLSLVSVLLAFPTPLLQKKIVEKNPHFFSAFYAETEETTHKRAKTSWMGLCSAYHHDYWPPVEGVSGEGERVWSRRTDVTKSAAAKT